MTERGTYTFYRMPQDFGQVDVKLTKAINALAKAASIHVRFSGHAEKRMDERDIDHESVLNCLRRGKAHAPEDYRGDLRSNVLHRGIGVRVVVGGLNEAVADDWQSLSKVIVVTVVGID